MRKYLSLLFCIILLANLCVSANAATGVPQEILDAVDSVVFIGFMLDTEDLPPNDVLDLKEERPDRFYSMHGNEFLLYASGSGFVIKNEGGEVLIATNDHVVKDDDFNGEIFVWLSDSSFVHADVVFSIPEKDLSVIRINESINKKPVKMAEEDANRGEAAYAVGFPGAADVIADGIAKTSEEAMITDGIISAIREVTFTYETKPAKLLMMNVSINHGNSGGPLFDQKGYVIGINARGWEGSNGAIAVSELLSLLEEYGIDIPGETIAQEETQPVEKKVPEGKIVNKALIIVVGAALGVVCLLLLRVVFGKEKRVRTGEELVVVPTDKVESPVKPATMIDEFESLEEPVAAKDEKDEMPDVDIGITKRRVQTDNHVDIGTVTMTGKGREKKENSKAFFSQPNKLGK